MASSTSAVTYCFTQKKDKIQEQVQSDAGYQKLEIKSLLLIVGVN
jgi:hypothetical protein